MATALDKIKKYRKSQQSDLNFLNNDSTALEKIQNYKLENNLNEQNTITNKTKPIVNNKTNSNKISDNNIFTQKNLLNNNKTSNFKEKKDSLNGLKPIEELNNNQLINIAKMRDEVENTDKHTKDAINMLESSKKVDDKKARKEVLSQFAVTPLLALKGASQKLEGAYDTMYDLSSKINEGLLNKTGVISDEEYNKRREQARNYVADNKTENFYNKYNLNDTLEKGEKHSLVKRDNLLGKTVEGVGGMLPTILLSSAVGVPSYNPTKASSLKGLIKNIGTHALINAPTNVTFGTSAYGNALAEAYSAGATDEEATKYAISSTAVEIASEWITGGIPGTNGVGGLDILVDKGIDKISNQLVKELVNYGYKMVGEGVEEAIAEILNPILKNATYSSGNEIDWKAVIESAIVGGLTAGVLEAPNTIRNVVNNRNQNNNINANNNIVLPRARTQNGLSENIQNNIDNTQINNQNNIVNNQKNTKSVEINNTQADNNKINNLRESSIKYNINQDLVNVAEKIISDKNYNIVFDDTITNNNQYINAQIKTLSNGETEIRINPNSDRAGEFLIMHEVTHAIETNSMKELVLDYASKNNEFNQALESLKQTYGTDDVSSEVLADISGQLFGNQEFINNLSMEKPNIFKRIYNSIVSLANKITGNSKESLFIKDLKNKWETAYRNTTTEQAVNNLGNEIKTSEKMGGYVPDINVTTNEISKYNISNYNDLKEVKQKIYDYYKDDYISTEQISKPITNIDTGLKIEIWKNGIMETFGNASYYKNLSITDKKIKLATMDSLAKMIKYGEIRANSATNYHNSNSTAEYYYLEHPITIDGNKYMVNMDIRKVPNYNGRFYIHSIDTKKVGTPGTSKKSPLTVPTNDNNIPQNNKNVKSGTSTMYSMQENINNTQELDNSSFSLSQRVSGDKLLDAQDLIEEIKSVGANVDEKGYVTLYHQTTFENAEKIRQSGKMYAKEPYVYFSTSKNASQADGRGNVKLEFKIPAEKLELDDIFSDNADVKIKLNGNKELNVSNYIVNEKKIKNVSSIEQDIDKYLMPEIYNRYKNEDKTKINETIEELKAYKETLKPDENDEDWNKNFLANQKIKALENGFDNVYDNLINQDRERLLKEYKSVPENIEKQINKIKSKETKTQELKKDYKNATSRQQAQFDIIQKTNPAPEESNYVWIKKPSDIKTFEEIINDEESFTWGDYSKEDALRDLKKGTVTIYSSYAIKNGTFVSTSYQQALDYAGGDPTKVHHRTVALDSVAWINGDEGQYAKISTKYSQNNSLWQAHLEKNYKATGTRTNLTNSKSKAMNPLEISKLTKEDSNTTSILKKINVSKGDGESKFASNIKNKTDMLNQKSKDLILSSDDVRFYEKVTNEESLNRAFERLNKNGKSETERWLAQKSENATSVDVAEGWILLKQYQDSIEKATDLSTKNELNRSMVGVAKKLREIGTKAGQTVQAFNILNRLTPEGMVYYAQSELSEAYEKMSQNKTKEWIDSNRDRFELTPEETKFIMDTMQEVQQMEDGYDKRVKLAEIQKLMTDKLPPERGAGIKAWMRISMLFNPKTQVRNVMGNAIIAPVNSFSDLFASIVDKQIAKKTGVRTTGKTNIKNYTKGFKTGLYQSYNDFKKGINTRNMQGNRFEVTEGKSFNDNSKIGKQLNKVDSLLSFMLDAGDRGFYEASFTNSINNQMILNNTTEVTQDMVDIATSEALSRTWQDNNNYTKFVLQTRNALNKINIKGYGLGDVLIPFAKTPANLTKAIVDYSPLGMINAINSGKNLKNSLSNGQYTAQMQHQFVQNLGKATAGTMLYILGYALAKAGITSGESDDDKDTKDFMKNTLGVSSYSIKIGNKTFTYDWAQPIAAPLSITANIVNKQKEGATLTENIISSLDTAGNILLEQSFMESINTVLNNNDGIVTGIQEAILELPSRAIPTLMKQIVDLTDDTQRTTFEYDKPLKTSINKIKAKIPGLSTTLSPVVDTMGREVQRYGGKNNIFNVFLNPANINTENISESAEEIYRVYKSTGDKTVMPRVIPYYFNEDGVKKTLTSKERSEFQKISGKIIEDNVSRLLNNINYVNMSDIDKSTVLNNIVNYAYNKARYEMFGTKMSNLYNKVNEWTGQGRLVSDYYANKEENDYSLENPQKYNTITNFNLSYESYTKYSKEINNIKNQYNDTNSRKNAVWQYIQNQKIPKVQKILLYNLCGGYSISNYKDYIFNYVNSQNISKIEKQEIWKYLYE